MSHHHKLTRRKFLGSLSVGCASLGLTPLYSGITNLGLMNAAAAANRSINGSSGYKGLVCIMLSGGNDSFNTLIPRGQSEYQEYAGIRTDLSIPRESLLPINPTNISNKEYGLHPSLINLQNLFEEGNAAFVANVGALVEPTTVNDYFNDRNLPFALFSHLDQRKHWQTSVPQDINALGWGGRMADILYTNNANQDISMNISLNGVNLFQKGNVIQEYAIGFENTGSVLLNGIESNSLYETLKRQTLDNMLDDTYHNILKTAYSNTVVNSNVASFEFSNAIASGMEINTEFGEDNFSQRLLMIAKTIAARDILGVNNQTFFVELGGWDTHDDMLENHAALLSQLDAAIGSFREAMIELGVEDDVLGFTMSDFGRKLTSNGDGSDHAWGGNSFVFGGGVKGKQIFGTYPDLYLGNDQDIGSGRLIPTTSCDEYFAELALWFGASASDLYQILPNIGNFWIPNEDGPLQMFS